MKRHTLHTRTLTAFALAAGTLAIPLAEARVAAEQAAQLGTTLTPLGATRAGNADGSIPAWTGTLYGLPKGLQWAGPGNPYPDPYGNEKPLSVITAQSAAFAGRDVDRTWHDDGALIATPPNAGTLSQVK